MELHLHQNQCHKIIYDPNKMERMPLNDSLYQYIRNNETGERYYYHNDSDLAKSELNEGDIIFIYVINLPKSIYGKEFSDWHTRSVKFTFKEKILQLSESIGDETIFQDLEKLNLVSSDDIQSFLDENDLKQPLMVLINDIVCVDLMHKTGPTVCPKLTSFQNMVKTIELEDGNGKGLQFIQPVENINKYLKEYRENEKLFSYPILGYVDDKLGRYPELKDELVDFILFFNEEEMNSLAEKFNEHYPGKDPNDFSAKINIVPKFSKHLYCFYLTDQDLQWEFELD